MGKGLGFRSLGSGLAGVAVLAGLGYLYYRNALLFHSMVELFGVLVAFCIFILVWNARHIVKESYFYLVGLSFGAAGLLNFLHVIYYPGLHLFASSSSNVSVQFWVAGRYVLSFSFLLAGLALKRNPRFCCLTAAYAAVTALLIAAILRWQVFPACMVPVASGWTNSVFSVASKWVFSIVMLIAAYLLYRERERFNGAVWRWLVVSMVFSSLTSLALMFYGDQFDLAKMSGHLCMIVSFFLAYKAIVEVGLTRPYHLLFEGLRRSETQLRGERDLVQKYLDLTADVIAVIGPDARVRLVNRRGCELLGYAEYELLGEDWFDKVVPLKVQAKSRLLFERVLRGEEKLTGSFESTLVTRSGEKRRFFWRTTLLTDEEGRVQGTLNAGQDVTERRKAEEALRRIEWLLSRDSHHVVASDAFDDQHNIAAAGTSRVLLNAVGIDLLRDIVSDFVDLLESSVAVYEKNGDYAFGLTVSGWCSRLRQASLRLCGTQDYGEAIRCGRWLCHESRWNEACRSSVERGEPVDIECHGGIRIYSVPIWAGGTIIGSISFGYGDPPKDQGKLDYIAGKFGLQTAELETLSAAYESRPPFIVDLAKKRLQVSANLIGAIVERKWAEEELKKARAELEFRVQQRTAELQSINMQLYQEIHERRQVNERLRATNQLLEKIFSSTDFMMAFVDTAFDIIRVNEAFAEAGGRSPEEYIGKNYFALCPGGDEVRTLFDGVLETGEGRVVFEKPCCCPGGKRGESWWDWNAQPVKDQQGKVEGIVFILINVTARKRAEEELVKAQKELGEAKRLSDIGMLAAIVAHELRNPLGVIRAAAYNLRRKAQLPALEKHFATIDKKILESDQIINNLLFYSRLRMPNYEAVPLCEMLEECLANAREKFSRWEVEVRRDLEALRGTMLEADPLQLREVFNNIVNNAYESFMNKQGLIEVSAARSATGDEVSIGIRDTGAGIEREDLARISQPFFTRKSRGTGLGLTVSYQIIHLHGGRIDVESARGAGTRFTIVLPLRRAVGIVN